MVPDRRDPTKPGKDEARDRLISTLFIVRQFVDLQCFDELMDGETAIQNDRSVGQFSE